jgi:hypothetical protein
MKKIILLTACISMAILSFAQADKAYRVTDSSDAKTLQEVIVRAFEQNRKRQKFLRRSGWLTGPLKRFNTSLLPAEYYSRCANGRTFARQLPSHFWEAHCVTIWRM